MEDGNTRQYGVPLYGASWVPYNAIRSINPKSDDVNADNSAVTSPEILVIAGGGGEGNSGIPNAILLSQYDSSTNSLSPQPIFRLGTASELPYRIGVHPRGDGIICAFPNGCRWFDWEMTNSNGNRELSLRSTDKVHTRLEGVCQQLALTFSEDGSLLAVGGEDGKIRVFKWPSMDVLVDENEAYIEVKDLHFSIDGKHLVSVGNGGPCKVWDVASSKVVASLQKENDENFRFCRFSQSSERDQVLYTLATGGKGVSIISWNTKSWKRIATKHITRDPVSAFNVSIDGKLLAIGTVEGGILIIDSSKMQVQMTVKTAHMGLVTALAFSHDSRALGSTSMDSSVTVTLVQDNSANGTKNWIIIFVILLAIAVYFLKSQGFLPAGLPFSLSD